MSTRAVVAVVGAGASGTLAAAHLAREAASRQRALEIVVFDSAPAGRGVAYSTTDPRHRLNVAAKGMSAWPDDGDHFLRWLRRYVAADFPAGGFAPRMHYAQYLADVLDTAARASAQVDLDIVRARVSDVTVIGRRLRISLDDGRSRPADAVVLALGHGEPATGWVPAELRHNRFFFFFFLLLVVVCGCGVVCVWRAGALVVMPARLRCSSVRGAVVADLGRGHVDGVVE